MTKGIKNIKNAYTLKKTKKSNKKIKSNKTNKNKIIGGLGWKSFVTATISFLSSLNQNIQDCHKSTVEFQMPSTTVIPKSLTSNFSLSNKIDYISLLSNSGLMPPIYEECGENNYRLYTETLNINGADIFKKTENIFVAKNNKWKSSIKAFIEKVKLHKKFKSNSFAQMWFLQTYLNHIITINENNEIVHLDLNYIMADKPYKNIYIVDPFLLNNPFTLSTDSYKFKNMMKNNNINNTNIDKKSTDDNMNNIVNNDNMDNKITKIHGEKQENNFMQNIKFIPNTKTHKKFEVFLSIFNDENGWYNNYTTGEQYDENKIAKIIKKYIREAYNLPDRDIEPDNTYMYMNDIEFYLPDRDVEPDTIIYMYMYALDVNNRKQSYLIYEGRISDISKDINSILYTRINPLLRNNDGYVELYVCRNPDDFPPRDPVLREPLILADPEIMYGLRNPDSPNMYTYNRKQHRRQVPFHNATLTP